MLSCVALAGIVWAGTTSFMAGLIVLIVLMAPSFNRMQALLREEEEIRRMYVAEKANYDHLMDTRDLRIRRREELTSLEHQLKAKLERKNAQLEEARHVVD